jgi:4-hydroxybenzoate polyprenyltransferase
MLSRILTYGSFIRFSHTVFALPFALSGSLLAAGSSPLTWGRVGGVVLAMATARTAAMGFNRIVDVRYDAQNPRTANRELPRGAMTMREAVTLVTGASVAFIAVTWTLGPLCFALSPVALGIVFWYSLAKRFTTYTQLFLGLALAVAPVGGWLAVGGTWGWPPWLLALGTALWVAGFDILYACVDIEVDRAQGLKSIPSKFGVETSLMISRVFHVSAVASLAAIAIVMPLGPLYLAGVVGVGMLLAYEQSMVRSDDLSRVKQAFDLNGWVGILYLMTTAGSIYVS